MAIQTAFPEDLLPVAYRPVFMASFPETPSFVRQAKPIARFEQIPLPAIIQEQHEPMPSRMLENNAIGKIEKAPKTRKRNTPPRQKAPKPKTVEAPLRTRQCLSCRNDFKSEGPGNRICIRCKGCDAWKSGTVSYSAHTAAF